MVFAAADPERDQLKIAANVQWLQDAQIKPGDRVNWPGSWSYSVAKTQRGDNSNTQYALLGLNAASEVGVPVKPEVWALRRAYWEHTQHKDGGWAYVANGPSVHREHDLRGDLEPDHHRVESGSRGRNTSTATRSRTAARGPSTSTSSAASTGWPATSASVRISASASSGAITTSTAWSAPAGSPASGSSADTTGTARGPKSWSTTRTSSRASGKAPDRSRAGVPSVWSRPASPCLFLAKGRAPVLDQQAPPRPGRRLEQRPRRHPQPGRPGLPRLEEPAHLAGRRPQHSPPSRT